MPSVAMASRSHGRALVVLVAAVLAVSVLGPVCGASLQAFVMPRSPQVSSQPSAAAHRQDVAHGRYQARAAAQDSDGVGLPWRTMLASAAALCVAFTGTFQQSGLPLPGPAPANALQVSFTGGTAGSGQKATKDPISLLQTALPLEEVLGEKAVAPVRLLQKKVEGTREQIQLRLWPQVESGIGDAKNIYKNDKKNFLKPIVAERQAQAEEILTKLDVEITALGKASQVAQAAGKASTKEVEAAAEAIEKGSAAQLLVGQLEELMVPPGYVTPLPKDNYFKKYFSNNPKLDGRATIDMVMKRPPGSTEKKFNLNSVVYPEVKFRVVVDGWAAPLSSGNFVDLVNRGWYDGKAITRSDGFIVQFGAGPKEDKEGFRPAPDAKIRRVPLEVGLKGSKEALYSETVDEAGKVGVPLKIPFQTDGTLAMARSENDVDSASSQAFLFLFEADMTPAGKNFLDGRYSTFGYTIEGNDFLRQIREGDIIVSAKVIDGLDNLKAQA